MMNHSENKEILRVLADCAAECYRCFDACLENERTDELVRVLRLCRDCARICDTTASFIASNSEHAQHLAKECADICRSCAEACGNHKDQEHECKPCADICRQCEEACNSFAGVNA
jgi:hypothetical protein